MKSIKHRFSIDQLKEAFNIMHEKHQLLYEELYLELFGNHTRTIMAIHKDILTTTELKS